jgi:hypothetical protein
MSAVKYVLKSHGNQITGIPGGTPGLTALTFGGASSVPERIRRDGMVMP